MCLSATLTTVFIFGLWYPANNMALLFAFSILFGISSSAVISLIPAYRDKFVLLRDLVKFMAHCTFSWGFNDIGDVSCYIGYC